MRLYLIRHGMPNYEKDCLTELGISQAKLCAESLKDIKFDRIYSSSHGRALETASFTCMDHKMEAIPQDWAREDIGARYFALEEDGKFQWIFWHKDYSKILRSDDVLRYGNDWINHPLIKGTKLPEGYRVMAESLDAFIKELGYVHDRTTRTYRKIKDVDLGNVALFAHGAFAYSFLSNMLDIPYPLFTMTHACMELTAKTIIEFSGEECIPLIITYNDFSHLEEEKRTNHEAGV